MAYAYSADIYCDDCAEKLITELDANRVIDSGDSDDYPQFDSSSGESDYPQHCADCQVFLENPLTDDGREYVIDTLVKDLARGELGPCVNEWLEYYDLDYEREPYFERFDICEAYYLFASHYHGGQNSTEYRIFGRLDRMRFKARDLSYARLSENGRAIYLNLASQSVARLARATRTAA